MKNKNGECDGRKKYQIIGKVKEQTEVSELCQIILGNSVFICVIAEI